MTNKLKIYFYVALRCNFCRYYTPNIIKCNGPRICCSPKPRGLRHASWMWQCAQLPHAQFSIQSLKIGKSYSSQPVTQIQKRGRDPHPHHQKAVRSLNNNNLSKRPSTTEQSCTSALSCRVPTARHPRIVATDPSDLPPRTLEHSIAATTLSDVTPYYS